MTRAPVGPWRLRDLHWSRPGLPVLAGLDLAVEPGQIHVLLGPSGCGKSSLLGLLADGGLSPESSGQDNEGADAQTVDGPARAPDEPVGSPGFALLPQVDSLLEWLNVLDNLALVRRLGPRPQPIRASREWALRALTELDLGDFALAFPAELSGGMRQRVSLLRAVAAGDHWLLLDEPFAALDAWTRGGLYGWLRQRILPRCRGIVMVSHDPEEALRLGDRISVLSARPARTLVTLEGRPESGISPERRAILWRWLGLD